MCVKIIATITRWKTICATMCGFGSKRLASFVTLNPFSVPIRAVLVAIGCPWNTGYVTTNMVLLDFEEEKLVGWDVHEPYTRLPASAREAPGCALRGDVSAVSGAGVFEGKEDI